MKIYNSLTRKLEPFKPIKKSRVGMYVCGPTVYDEPHIGHARAAYIFEVIRNYLEYKGYKVKFVKNITDVDDKIIAKARQEFPDQKIDKACSGVAEKYTKRYYDDMNALGIRRASIRPFATKHIGHMIKYIAELIKKGFAYQSGGSVYFDVRKFKEYGKLSGQDLDQMQSAARTEKDEQKKNPLDFVLWKKAKQDEPFWSSPWGAGRPGWHIECSVMSSKYLGNEFDIHGGGIDLIFPHHENEIAQSRAFSGKSFARIWMHNGLLTINQQKMAKSLGNFITIKDVLNRYPADILKLFYLQAHYSSPIDFSWQKLEEIKKGYERIDILKKKLEKYRNVKGGTGQMKIFKDRFIERMDDNFDTPGALAVLFEMVNGCNKLIDSDEEFKPFILNYALTVMKEMAEVFGLTFLTEKRSVVSDEEIEKKIKLRLELKEQRKYKEADEIRQNLATHGIMLEDTKDAKTEWRRKL